LYVSALEKVHILKQIFETQPVSRLTTMKRVPSGILLVKLGHGQYLTP